MEGKDFMLLLIAIAIGAIGVVMYSDFREKESTKVAEEWRKSTMQKVNTLEDRVNTADGSMAKLASGVADLANANAALGRAINASDEGLRHKLDAHEALIRAHDLEIEMLKGRVSRNQTITLLLKGPVPVRAVRAAGKRNSTHEKDAKAAPRPKGRDK